MPNSGKFTDPTNQPIEGTEYPSPLKGYISTNKDYKEPKLENISETNWVSGSLILPDNGLYNQKHNTLEETFVSIAYRSNSRLYTAIRLLTGTESFPELEGLIQIADTEYYKYIESMAYSYGPATPGTPMTIENLGVYRAYYSTGGTPGIIIEFKNSSDVFVFTTSIPLATPPDHISLTFDSNGSHVVGYEVSGNSYIYFFDPLASSYVTTDIGPVKSPFVALSSFNEVISLSRQVFCVYIKNGNTLCYRAQNDRYTIEYESLSDVVDILAIGITDFESLKIVFVKESSPGVYEIDNIATERSGLWNKDYIDNTVTASVDRMEIRDVSVWMTEANGITEKPIGIVNREVTDVVATVFTYEKAYLEGIEERPIGIVNREITDLVVTVRPQLFHYTVEEPVPAPGTLYEHTVELVSFELVDVRVDLEQGEPLPLPGSLYTHITELVSISFNHTLTGLINLIDSVDELMEEDYTVGSWEDMIEFRDAAQIVVDNPGSNQNEINTAWNNLDTAINTLVPV